MIERGWIGGENTGRSTTAMRSNYFHSENVALYDLALNLDQYLLQKLGARRRDG